MPTLSLKNVYAQCYVATGHIYQNNSNLNVNIEYKNWKIKLPSTQNLLSNANNDDILRSLLKFKLGFLKDESINTCSGVLKFSILCIT